MDNQRENPEKPELGQWGETFCPNCGETLLDVNVSFYNVTREGFQKGLEGLGLKPEVRFRFRDFIWYEFQSDRDYQAYKKGHPNTPKILDADLAKPFLEQLAKKQCSNSFCEKPLVDAEIWHYQHDGGMAIPGFRHKQWVYWRCKHCNWTISFYKIKNIGDVKE